MPEKLWYQSRAVIGGLVAALAGIAALFGVDIDQPVLTDLFLSLGSLIGGALAVWGRVRAEPPVRLRKPKPGPDEHTAT